MALAFERVAFVPSKRRMGHIESKLTQKILRLKNHFLRNPGRAWFGRKMHQRIKKDILCLYLIAYFFGFFGKICRNSIYILVPLFNCSKNNKNFIETFLAFLL